MEFRRFDHPFAIDLAHNVLLAGAVLSKKPERVLELGIGTGYCTWTLLNSLAYNGKGTLTCVDNWHDTRGVEPPGVDAFRRAGATVIVSEEGPFVRACPENAFDFLVSDADHLRSASWLYHHLRIVTPDGFLFFHDTANPDYPGLMTIEQRVAHLPHYHFKQSSRPDERCERGWLWVINKKVPP